MSNPETPAGLAATVSQYFARSGDYRDVIVSAEGPIIKTQNSILVRANCSEFPQPILIKKCIGGTLSAADQFEALKRLQTLFADTPATVPTPHALLPEDNIVVMDYVDAKSVDAVVRNKSSRDSDIRHSVKGAGEWLGLFHNRSQMGDERVGVEQLLTNIEAMYANQSAASDYGLKSRVGAAIQLLNGRSPAVADAETAYAYSVADFKPGNILVSADTAYGIDVSIRHFRPVVVDVAHFLNNLTLDVLASRQVTRLIKLNDYEKCFESAYAVHGLVYTPEALAWTRLYDFLVAFLIRRDTKESRIKYVLKKGAYGLLLRRYVQGLKRT